jgi:hypothetical protein
MLMLMSLFMSDDLCCIVMFRRRSQLPAAGSYLEITDHIMMMT